MVDFFEIFIWGIGFALLHEGIARRAMGRNGRHTKIAIIAGVLILFSGVVLWYGSAQTLKRLSETLEIPTASTREKKEIENIAPLQRRDVSIKFAKAAFAKGNESVEVLTEDGRWIPFEPDAQDLKARETHLKMLAEIKQRRQDVLANAMAAEREYRRWLASLLIAVFTGFVGGVFLRKNNG
jgi:hypothetical protein